MTRYIGIISLIIYSILVLILIFNLKEKNNFIRNAFIILFSLVVITFLVYNQEIINEGLRFFVRFIYFPTFNSYLVMILLTVCGLLYSIFSESLSNKFKVINYVFSSFLIVTYIIFMTLNVDVSLYNSLYSSSSLVWLRIGTRGFVLWGLILMVVRYLECFKSNRWTLWWYDISIWNLLVFCW